MEMRIVENKIPSYFMVIKPDLENKSKFRFAGCLKETNVEQKVVFFKDIKKLGSYISSEILKNDKSYFYVPHVNSSILKGLVEAIESKLRVNNKEILSYSIFNKKDEAIVSFFRKLVNSKDFDEKKICEIFIGSPFFCDLSFRDKIIEDDIEEIVKNECLNMLKNYRQEKKWFF
ncbi:MAG: hypothetical protein ACTSP3_01960 [Candidatus Heimdallarchaeaceae archaeon]